MKKFYLLACLLLCLSSRQSFAQGETVTAGSKLLNFQLYGVQLFQKEGRNNTSLGIAWYPTLELNENFSLHFLLGTSWLRNTSNDIFYTLEYGCLGGVKLNQIELLIGGGAQVWFGNGGMAPEATAALSYPLNYGIFSDLFTSYSLVFIENNTTHLIKLGLVLNFNIFDEPNAEPNIETVQPAAPPEMPPPSPSPTPDPTPQ